MPARALISKELAELLGALAHPHRLRIMIELHDQTLDVNSLQQILSISHSSVSQNLAILRAHRLVHERREGRHVFYSLTDPRMAGWLLEGLQFLDGHVALNEQMRGDMLAMRDLWQQKHLEERHAAGAAG